MAQKLKEMGTSKHELQDGLVREVRKLSEGKYANSWNSNLTVFTIGKKTRLFDKLMSVAGIP